MSRMRWDGQTDGRTFPLIHLRRLLRSAADKNLNRRSIVYHVDDYDFCFRILLLDKGRVKEHDSPAVLIAKPDGLFRAMAKDAGLI